MAKATKTKAKAASSQYQFKISSDWYPTKSTSNTSFLDAVVNTAMQLLSKESFPIPMTQVVKDGGYKDPHSACSSIRTALRKRIGKSKIGEYGMHVVKDHAGKPVAIRVRKK